MLFPNKIVKMKRREFLVNAGRQLCAFAVLPAFQGKTQLLYSSENITAQQTVTKYAGPANSLATVTEMKGGVNTEDKSDLITLFMCGDVMTGRGIDQILSHPSDPQIYESYMKTASGYVELAERKYGPLPKPAPFAYIWGDILDEFERMETDVRIINLETAITKSDAYWRGKGINYRMHPNNIPCITAAAIDCCVLANNHVLDWGYAGLDETLQTLRNVNIKTAGAGNTIVEAEKPAILEIPGKGRVLVFSYGSPTSGIPYSWAVSKCRAGVNFLRKLSNYAIQKITENIQQTKRPGDIVIASLHWGGNWGYDVPVEQTEFAHRLIDEAGVDVIHGHSSHHPKGLEVYKDKPIIYGCGDFLNDYEGISGHEEFRGDLGLMYFTTLQTLTGKLVRFELKSTRINGFRVNRASNRETEWLYAMLNREGKKFATSIEPKTDNTLEVHWR